MALRDQAVSVGWWHLETCSLFFRQTVIQMCREQTHRLFCCGYEAESFKGGGMGMRYIYKWVGEYAGGLRAKFEWGATVVA